MLMNEEEKRKLFDDLEHIRGLLHDIKKGADHEKEARPRHKALTRPGSNIDIARRIYSERRARAKHFSEQGLFGEPAWDMLLDLFIRQELGEIVSIKSACIGSAAPHTTALRWLNALAIDGLVRLEDDPFDQRRRNVSLTPLGTKAMKNFLAEIERAN